MQGFAAQTSISSKIAASHGDYYQEESERRDGHLRLTVYERTSQDLSQKQHVTLSGVRKIIMYTYIYAAATCLSTTEY